jgi:hypothetical protein
MLRTQARNRLDRRIESFSRDESTHGDEHDLVLLESEMATSIRSLDGAQGTKTVDVHARWDDMHVERTPRSMFCFGCGISAGRYHPTSVS